MLLEKTAKLAKRSILELVLLLLCVVLSFKADGFFTANNFLNVLRNVSMQGVIAFGMTMVIISGEIDLSVGSAVAFAGCLTAVLTKTLIAAGLPDVAAVIIAVFASLVTGFTIGSLTGYIRAFID